LSNSLLQIEDEFDFILLGNLDNVLRNLPKVLKLEGFKTLAIGAPGMELTSSSWVERSIVLGSSNQSEFLDELLVYENELLKLSGTFLWCSDEIMGEVAKRDFSVNLKKKILPISNPEYFGMLNSKVGQDRAFRLLKVPTPESFEIASNSSKILRNERELPILAKRDSSGGGIFIREIKPDETLDLMTIPQDWFPLLAQDKCVGVTVSVEAFYQNGKLKLWLYSYFEEEMYKFGPSIVRRYTKPESLDFLRGLEALGEKSKLTGFVNISLIYDANSNQHQIIEFDARPNAWHQAFYDFSIPFKEIWSGEMEFERDHYIGREVTLYEPYRLLNHFLEGWQLIKAFRVIKGHSFKEFGSPITSPFYDKDKMRLLYLRLYLFALFPIRSPILKSLIILKRNLPRAVISRIDRSTLKRVLLRFLVN
jgi:hypothetical protein